MSKQADRRRKTYEALLEAALALFSTQGYEATSIEEIVHRAGVTKGALYHLVKSKEALFELCFRHIAQGWVASVAGKIAGSVDPWEQLERGIEAFVDLACDKATCQLALIDGPAVLGWQRYREIDNEYFLGAIVEVLKVAMPDYSAVEVQTLARAIVASLCELTIHAAISGKPAAVRQAKQTSLTLVAGLRAAYNS